MWFAGLRHAVVAAEIECYMFDRHSTQQWVFVNRGEAEDVLRIRRESIALAPKRVVVYGGHDIPLPEDGYRWDDIVLDSNANRLIREDFESFFEREEWFTQHRLPYRRGYLLHGPPGNGKSSVVRTMACHPLVSACTADLADPDTSNETVTRLFNAAADNAPGLVILEDLDRLFGRNSSERSPNVSLQHLLNCLDGVGNRNGVIVAATANEPSLLDPAILRRPGRFDRVALFPNPTFEMRLSYLRHLCDGSLLEPGLAAAARQSDRFSFAQVREGYILGGQFALARDGNVTLEGLRLVKYEGVLTTGREGRAVGFCQEAAMKPTAVCETPEHCTPE
jgi:SpoVK/Ycf46/Vps4 family AAA+-type ATPase